MRSRGLFFAFLLVAGVAALPHFAHAAIPFLGHIIPDASNSCPAAWGMVVTVINNLIEFGITVAIVFVAPVMIAYAGFLMVIEPMSPGGHTKARGILLNTVVGIVIALAAWLIVDAVMAALTPNGRPFGENWATLISSNGASQCLSIAASLNQTASGAGITGVSGNGSIYTGPLGQCGSGNTACSVSALQAAGFTASQAAAMSCIALTENSGNATGCNGNACGTFQIMLTSNPLVGPACAQYNNGNSTLNCPSLCHAANGGAVRNEASCQPCVQAANNPQCNAQAAQHLYAQGGYAPWTSHSDNTKSGGCIQKYGSTGA